MIYVRCNVNIKICDNGLSLVLYFHCKIILNVCEIYRKYSDRCWVWGVKITLSFCPSWSCIVIYIILHYNMYYFHFTLQELCKLTWVLAEAFRCHVHHFLCLTVLVELPSTSYQKIIKNTINQCTQIISNAKKNIP